MKKRIIYLGLLISLFFIASAPLALTASAQTGIATQGMSPGCYSAGDCSLCDFIQVGVNISDLIVSLAGAVAILMFIIGGIFMITAYGSDRINAGKNIIVATVIGILIILSAWTIVNTLVLAIFGATNSSAFTSAIKSVAPGATSLTDYSCQSAPATPAAPTK